MDVQILYFADLRERRGSDREVRTVDPGTTIGGLFDQIFPDHRGSVACTRNQAIVPPDTVLEDGDEVSFLPPLGGG